MHYAINKGIIHELLDDEIIIANLESGIYCSIRESGVPIWQLLIAGKEEDFIAAALAEHYGLDSATVLRSVQAHVAELVAADILMSSSITNDNSSVDPSFIAWPVNYLAPLFEQYDDMQNLLMLDPIHEVDEQGWPNKAE